MRNTTGIVTDADLAVLSWTEWRPRTLVQVMSPELDEAALHRIAEGLRVIDEGAWKTLYATAERHELPRDNLTPILREAPPNISGDSFFLMRPVLRRVGPPCAAVVVGDSAAVLADVREGPEVAASSRSSGTRGERRRSSRGLSRPGRRSLARGVDPFGPGAS